MEDLLNIAEPRLKASEGLRLKPYTDTTGNLTIGWGYKLSNGISTRVAQLLFQEAYDEIVNELKVKVSSWIKLSPNRQYVLVSMAYNMGVAGLLTFHKMLAYLDADDYPNAAEEIRNSLENKEVPNRVYPLAKIMETNVID